MTRRPRIHVACALLVAAVAAPAVGREEEPRSLMARVVGESAPRAQSGLPHALRDASLFAITPPEVREFKPHDLVQIIVRETSRAQSKQELDTKKKYDLNTKVTAWPHLTLSDLLNLQIRAGDASDLPQARLNVEKDFQGEGDYKRQDDLTARLTAEILEILPNGNLVLESRTHIKTDDEVAEMRVTGVCRQDDVTSANTILSSQLHDLMIEKVHSGELRRSTNRGIIARILDTLFAF